MSVYALCEWYWEEAQVYTLGLDGIETDKAMAHQSNLREKILKKIKLVNSGDTV